MVLHTHKIIAYTHTLSHSLPSHKTTSHFQTNSNLLSLICWKHLLYVFQVEDLESSQIINVAPDGAIDHVLKTGWSDIRGSCVYTDSFTTAHFKTVTVQNMKSAYVQTIPACQNFQASDCSKHSTSGCFFILCGMSQSGDILTWLLRQTALAVSTEAEWSGRWDLEYDELKVNWNEDAVLHKTGEKKTSEAEKANVEVPKNTFPQSRYASYQNAKVEASKWDSIFPSFIYSLCPEESKNDNVDSESRIRPL